MNTVQRCGNCRFWGVNVAEFPGGPRVERQTGEWRQCGRVERYDSYETERTRHELAVVEDGSDYYAAIKSRAEFGCVLFERSPEETVSDRREDT